MAFRRLDRFWPAWLRGGWGVAAVLATAYTALYILWSFTHWGSAQVGLLIAAINQALGRGVIAPDPQAFIADVGYLPLTLFGGLACLRIWRKEEADTQLRRAWGFLALTFLCNFLGDLLWFNYEIIQQTAPFPSWADLAYLLFYPAALAALVSFPFAPVSRADRRRLLLDAGIVVAGGSLLVWYFVLGPSVQGLGWTLEALILSAYPIGDLVVLYGLAYHLFRRPAILHGSGLGFILAGMLLFILGDAAYLLQGLTGTYVSGSPLDSTWIMTYLLFALAALVQHAHLRVDQERFAVAQAPRHLWLFPYAVLLGSFVFVAWAVWAVTGVGPTLHGLLVLALALAGLVAGRQILEVRENRRLHQEALTRLTQLEETGALLGRAQSMARIGTLASGVAHEVNTPLSIILGSAESLRRRLQTAEPDKAAIVSTLKRIEEAARQGARITQALVAYAHGPELSVGRTTAQQIFNTALEYAAIPRDAQITVRIAVDEDAPAILCDPDHVSRAVAQLIQNAREATSPPGTIELRAASTANGGLTLIVADLGAGMTSEVVARAFDPFYTTRPLQGAGLGLSICRGIIEEHDGQVQIDSHPNHGTTVTITLPPEPHVKQPPAAASR